jgi:hypothetical protein
MWFEVSMERKRNERLSGEKRKEKRKRKKKVFIARILYGYTHSMSYTN